MSYLQEAIGEEFGVQPDIDPAQEIETRVQFLVDYLASSSMAGYVLGISGGLDSTLAGRLAQLAVERARAEGREATFVGLRLPYRVQHDEDDAAEALDFIAADETITFNIGPAVDAFEAEYDRAVDLSLTDFTKGNTKARMRMVAHYAVAGDRRLLVLGTDHGAESVTGFFTKFGDGGADVTPLSGLDKRQNRLLLRHLGAPERLWAKLPTADLLDHTVGQPDEVELGLSYDQIDDYLEGQEVAEAAADRIERLWKVSRHKRALPVTPADTWWRESENVPAPADESDPWPPTQLEGQRALVVIDMQNSYFELPGLKGKQDSLLPAVNQLIRAARASARPVILVRTQHQPDRSTWTLNMLEDDQGFAFPGTAGAQFVEGLDMGPHQEVIKTRDSAFHGTDLQRQLERLDVNRVLICGVSTHSCIQETASDAFAYDFRVAIAADAVTSENPALAAAALTHLHDELRQPVLNQEDSLAFLNSQRVRV